MKKLDKSLKLTCSARHNEKGPYLKIKIPVGNLSQEEALDVLKRLKKQYTEKLIIDDTSIKL